LKKRPELSRLFESVAVLAAVVVVVILAVGVVVVEVVVPLLFTIQKC
jgi:uncharacterized membrane protein YidH (DUF202 family)